MKPPPTPMMAARSPVMTPSVMGGHDADIKARLSKARAERKPQHPIMLPGAAQRWGMPFLARADRAHAFQKHDEAYGGEERHIGQRNDEIQLPDAAQPAIEKDAAKRAHNAA